MRYFRNICQGVLIFLFMGFVVSMVYGTSRSEVSEIMQQAVVANQA